MPTGNVDTIIVKRDRGYCYTVRNVICHSDVRQLSGDIVKLRSWRMKNSPIVGDNFFFLHTDLIPARVFSSW